MSVQESTRVMSLGLMTIQRVDAESLRAEEASSCVWIGCQASVSTSFTLILDQITHAVSQANQIGSYLLALNFGSSRVDEISHPSSYFCLMMPFQLTYFDSSFS